MGIQAGRSGFQLKPSSAMITSPNLRRVEQGLPYPAGSAVRRHGKVLDPGTLPESHGDDVEIDSRKPNDGVVICYQHGRPRVSHGRFQPTSRNGWGPVRRVDAWRCQQPFIGSNERRHIGR
jgi:hypothetical protein